MPAPLAIAHRAGNERLSLQRAVDAGVGWVETDVWWHYGTVVARHEKALWRLPVLYDKWKVAVSARKPLCLTELCLRLESGPQLLLDFKGSDARLAQKVVETLQSLGAVERSAICGQDWSLLDRARALEPHLRVFYSLQSERQFTDLLRRSAAPPAIAAASIWEGLLTSRRVADLRERGISVVAWTVNSQRRAAELVDAGVAGIISDRHGVLASIGTSEPRR